MLNNKGAKLRKNPPVKKWDNPLISNFVQKFYPGTGYPVFSSALSDRAVTKIYLIGYMASGKSKLGKELSGMTGLAFIDLDEVFEERYRIGIVDFFDKYGDSVFRQIEHQLLLKTESLDNTIIATGGGTPCSEENIRFIKAHGISIYIQMDIVDLVARLRSVKRKRPLLKNIPVEDLEKFVRNQMKEREPYYLRADHLIAGPVDDLEPLADLIKSLIR
jgi:shikimate kinase